MPANGPRLPADLEKLRDRYLAEHPQHERRVTYLAQVPEAFRHILGLQLDLEHADVLPRRYRDIAETTACNRGRQLGNLDAVEQLVVDFAKAVRNRRAHLVDSLRPELERYFTEPQIVELILTLTLAPALARCDRLLDPLPDR